MTIFLNVVRREIWIFLAAAVISLPCLAETPAVNGAKVKPELRSSGDVQRKDLQKDAMKDVPGKAIEGAAVDCGAKGGGSVCSPDLVAVAPSDVATKNGDKDTAKEEERVSQKDVDHFWFCVYLAIAIAPIFFSYDQGTPKPNVELTGAPLARPAERKVRGGYQNE